MEPLDDKYLHLNCEVFLFMIRISFYIEFDAAKATKHFVPLTFHSTSSKSSNIFHLFKKLPKMDKKQYEIKRLLNICYGMRSSHFLKEDPKSKLFWK